MIKAFTELLSRIRTASHAEDDIKVIQSRFHRSILTIHLMHFNIWAENAPVNEHNERKLDTIQTKPFIVKAKNLYPKNVNKQDIDRVLATRRSETYGLDSEIHIKEGARVKPTTNIDIQDRLINEQMGIVIKIDINSNNKPSVLYVKFDDEKAEKKQQSMLVPPLSLKKIM